MKRVFVWSSPNVIRQTKTKTKTLCHSQVVVFKEEGRGEFHLESPIYTKIFVRPRRRQNHLGYRENK